MYSTIDTIRQFLGQLELWINDNIGSGDGTQHIWAIWKDDPEMARHLKSKWNEYRTREAENINATDDTMNEVQRLAFLDFLVSLDDDNTRILIKYIAQNGRSK